MPNSDAEYVLGLKSKQAAKLLMRDYNRQKRKSWPALARKYELSTAKCYRIAHGTMKVNPAKDLVLMRAIMREFDVRRRPAMIRRLIRKVGVPFLAGRQRSAIGVYGVGGRRVTWEE